jgi:hypothetical protein
MGTDARRSGTRAYVSTTLPLFRQRSGPQKWVQGKKKKAFFALQKFYRELSNA